MDSLYSFTCVCICIEFSLYGILWTYVWIQGWFTFAAARKELVLIVIVLLLLTSKKKFPHTWELWLITTSTIRKGSPITGKKILPLYLGSVIYNHICDTNTIIYMNLPIHIAVRRLLFVSHFLSNFPSVCASISIFLVNKSLSFKRLTNLV